MKKKCHIKAVVVVLSLLLIIPLLLSASCNHTPEAAAESKIKNPSPGTPENPTEDQYRRDRLRMVQLLEFYGIKAEEVMAAMSRVRRHRYIPEPYRQHADPYGDHPCPIGHGQTISQPYIVAYMTEKMQVKPGEKVLEIGTGSGYQAAVLAELGAKVYSIEIVPELAAHAKKILAEEGYGDVQVLRGDGYNGWPEHAPYNMIIVTCAPENVPAKLVEQLEEGGRMILPLGAPYRQRLVILRKKQGKIKKENDLSVMFVPMVHENNR
jgi:protein-L-isoaspartate(D-aspartate) O-methyltransferase